MAQTDMTVTLVRHGKTPGNLRGAFIGRLDQPVTPEGEAELRQYVALGRYPRPQMVLCSPMRRCLQTAAIVFPESEPQIVEDLRERDFGAFEDKTHSEIIALPGCEGWGMDAASMRFPGGEELEPFYRRCTDAFWQAVEWAREEGVAELGVVTHGGVIMALMYGHTDASGSYYDWMSGNGGGYEVRCDAAARRFLTIRSLEK